MRLQLGLLIAFAFASTASATTYYVAPAGIDTNNGSITAPFRTITKGASMARPGDVVSVRGGVYNEIVKASAKGTSAARIIIQSYPGEKAIIDGTGTAANTDLVQLGSAEYLDFTGFEVRNSTRLGISGWGSKNLRILNNTVTRAYRGGIYVGYSAFGSTYDITIEGNTVFNNVLMNETHNMPNGGWGQSISVQLVDRATITGNRVYQNDGEGIVVLQSDNALVQSNEVSDSFSVGIYLDNAQSTTVNGNLVYSTGNTRYYRDGHPAAGISNANESYSSGSNPLSDNRITNNIVINSRWGFYYGNYEAGGGMKNTLVANNTFYNATAAMIWLEASAHAGTAIQNNIFAQASSGVMHGGTASGMTFRNNNWYGGSAGAAAGAGDVVGNPRLTNAGGFAAADYKLANLSPAIHTGIEIPSVTTDFWGNARTPTMDIGAHEESLSLGSSSPVRAELDAPTGVVVLDRSSTAIQLSWTAVGGAAAYRVYRDRELVATVTATAWTDAPLAPMRAYSYAVTSTDGQGSESAPSVNVTAITLAARDTEAPSIPSRIAAKVTADTVVLTWQASSDNTAVAGYLIYRNGAHVATVTEASWTDTGLAPSTSYVYAVQAVDAAKNYSMSGQLTATTASTTPARMRAAGRR